MNFCAKLVEIRGLLFTLISISVQSLNRLLKISLSASLDKKRENSQTYCGMRFLRRKLASYIKLSDEIMGL